MGIYTEYIEKRLSPEGLVAARKEQLCRIAALRNSAVLVYAADYTSQFKAQRAPMALDASDLVPITDQLDNLQGNSVDVILETPGGNGTVAEDIVRMLRHKFEKVSFIIPGQAKSAGTIMAMSGDEILMDFRSAVGPIDAQINFEGKQFSAEALLKGIDKIVATAEKEGKLNRAYIPILQRLSPGDIQNAENALDFARVLVRDWLCQYKFKDWHVHRTHNVGSPVTVEQKKARAQEVADALCDHSNWLSHGRSIRMKDLTGLGLEIVDFATQLELADAIGRYYALLRISFDTSPIFKLIETPTSQINRVIQMQQQQAGVLPFLQAAAPGQIAQGPTGTMGTLIGAECPQCRHVTNIQADFDVEHPLQPNAVRFPSNNVIICSKCKAANALGDLKQRLEMQASRKVFTK